MYNLILQEVFIIQIHEIWYILLIERNIVLFSNSNLLIVINAKITENGGNKKGTNNFQNSNCKKA